MATITVSPITNVLPRDELAKFLPTPRAVRAFEGMQTDVTETIPDAMGQIVDLTNALLAAPYITWVETPTLEQGRALAVTSALRLTNDGARLILGLAETGIAAGTYGGAAQTLSIQVDLFGRLAGAQTYDLLSDNVAEGTSHLYYTDARARAALSGGHGINYDSETGEIALDTANLVTRSAGSVASTSGAPAVLATLQSEINGTYLVSASLATSQAAGYSAVSIVTNSLGVLRTTPLQTATAMTISVSGVDIRATQSSGVPQTIHYAVTKIS